MACIHVTQQSRCSWALLTSSGYIAQWSERLTADQQVPGSNSGVPFVSLPVLWHTIQATTTQHRYAVSWKKNYMLTADSEASSLRCAQPCHSILYCKKAAIVYWHCPMAYFEVAVKSTLALSGACCGHRCWHHPWVACLMSKHTCWSFFNKCLEVSGLVAVLVVFNEGLWSWIEAILQESMPSVLIHMPHTFQFPFFMGHGCWFPSRC